jgi:hypothetical protein
MAQVFGRHFGLLLKLCALVALLLIAVIAFVYRGAVSDPPWVGHPVAQTVPFSHKHHVGDDGIDCRYCHTTVETSAHAGIPDVATCMSCHSQLYTDAAMLQPLRDAWQKQATLSWTRVHDLPDFVYFDHSAHVNKGVGCSSCHGRVDQMPLTWRSASLKMQWCLDCHRAPEKVLRQRGQIFDMHWKPPGDQRDRGEQLLVEYGIRKPRLTECSLCHR